MKKNILLTVCLLCVTSVWAQECKVELGIDVGPMHYINQPALSLFEDVQSSYLCMTENVLVGVINPKGVMYGLQFGVGEINTSAVAVAESAMMYNLSLLMRRYDMVTEHLGLSFGMNFTGTLLNNRYTYLGEKASRIRYGCSLGFEGGVRYLFSEGYYIGLCGTAQVIGSLVKQENDLPAGLTANRRKEFSGYGLMMQFGLIF